MDQRKIKLGNLITELFWFWFWEWMPSIGRKVGIPRGILPHVQGGSWNPDLTPFYQAVGIQTEPGIREGSYGQFYPNTT